MFFQTFSFYTYFLPSDNNGAERIGSKPCSVSIVRVRNVDGDLLTFSQGLIRYTRGMQILNEFVGQARTPSYGSNNFGYQMSVQTKRSDVKCPNNK